MTTKEYERKLQATVLVNDFMGGLALRYSAEDMKLLWAAEGEMCRRYGIVFVADAISKDRKDAELALFRYGKKLPKEEEPEEPERPYTEILPPATRAHRRKKYGKAKQVVRAFGYLAAGAIAVAVFSFNGFTGW